MAADNRYLLTALPALGELGSTPPLGGGELMARLDDAPAAELAGVVFLLDDLMQAMSVGSGQQDDHVQPAVLSSEQVRGQAPLPPYLADEGQPTAQPARLATDAMWERYFRHGLQIARRRGSEFLEQWLASELALRNALARARATALGLDPNAYVVAADLAGTAGDFPELVAAWSAAPNPLAALKVLDQWRWSWLRDNDHWFSFADDEVAAYAAKLSLLVRWDRLARAA